MDETPGVPEHSAEEWEGIKELVYQWETERPQDLDAWLTERCPDGPIRREVERLARAAATSGDFLLGRAAEEHLGIAASHPVHIGRYRVIEELGSGGLGVVYAAYDPALERKVAIKVLADKASPQSERRKRLRWDAKAASATQHPNIVVIYDVGNDAGLDYIVMECVEGQPLGQLMSAGRLPPRTVLKYALQIADALDAAHRGGIIHRDLNPNNIMITKDGWVKLLDFGLAKHDDPGAEHTSLPATIEGHFAGTVAYVSPEQAEGKPVDVRGDIFSFGCILFEMLTGKQAFQGQSAVSILGSIIHQPAPALRDEVPPLDERFETIVQGCLRKEPDQRFSNIVEVRSRLAEMVQANEPGQRPVRGTRRRWIRRAMGAGIAALLVFGAIRVAPWQLGENAERAYMARLTVDSGLASFPTISRDGKMLAYVSDRAGDGSLDLWVQHWGQADATRLTFDHKDKSSPAFTPAADNVVYRSEQDGGGLYTISTFGGQARLLAPGGRDGGFSWDGNWLAYWMGTVGGAFHRGCAKIYIMPASGGQPEEFPTGFEAAAYPVWSSTAKQFIFLGRKAGSADVDWWVASIADHTVRPTGLLQKFRKSSIFPQPRSYFLMPAAWLTDSTVLFSAKTFDTINLWGVRVNADGGTPGDAHQWTSGTGIEDYPAATLTTADGSTRTVFAALTVSTAIWRIPLNSGGEASGPAQRLIQGLTGIGSPSVSADGGKMTFSANQPGGQSLRFVDLGLQPPAVPAVVHLSLAVDHPVMSGDGSTLAWATGRDGYIMPSHGGTPKKICSACGPPTHLSFDGNAALFEGGGTSEDLILWVRGQKSRPLFSSTDNRPWMQNSGRFSPDRRWVAFSGWHDGSDARQILIVPVTPDGVVPTGQILELTNDEFVNKEPFWSPDGKRIYFVSDRDGSDCVWARNIDPVSAHPSGPAFPVAHFHSAAMAIHGPGRYSGTIGLSVARDFLVLTLTETGGNVWERSNRTRL